MRQEEESHVCPEIVNLGRNPKKRDAWHIRYNERNGDGNQPHGPASQQIVACVFQPLS